MQDAVRKPESIGNYTWPRISGRAAQEHLCGCLLGNAHEAEPGEDLLHPHTSEINYMGGPMALGSLEMLEAQGSAQICQ